MDSFKNGTLLTPFKKFSRLRVKSWKQSTCFFHYFYLGLVQCPSIKVNSLRTCKCCLRLDYLVRKYVGFILFRYLISHMKTLNITIIIIFFQIRSWILPSKWVQRNGSRLVKVLPIQDFPETSVNIADLNPICFCISPIQFFTNPVAC